MRNAPQQIRDKLFAYVLLVNLPWACDYSKAIDLQNNRPSLLTLALGALASTVEP